MKKTEGGNWGQFQLKRLKADRVRVLLTLGHTEVKIEELSTPPMSSPARL